MTLLKHTYRSILRVTRELDRSAWCRSLLLAKPKEIYIRSPTAEGSVVELTQEERTLENFNSIVFEYNGHSEMYRPSSKSLTDCAKEQFQMERPSFDLDLALMSIRHLHKIKKVVDETNSTKKDSPLSCSSLSFPMTESIEAGSMLVCHPASCLSQPTLNKSIILLTDVTSQSVGGLILNKIIFSHAGSAVKVRDILIDNKSKRELEPLLDNVVFRGGDVMTASLICMSSVSIEGSTKVRSGVYVCNDIVSAAKAISRGEVSPSSIKVMAGHCGWAPTQLDVELERTVWFLAHSDKILALDQNIDSTSQMWDNVVAGFGSDFEHLIDFDGDAVLRNQDGHSLIEEHYRSLEASLNLST